MIKRYRITGHELLFQNRLCGSADRQGQPHAGAIKYQSGILAPIVQFGYGAYNLTHNNIPKTALLTAGTAFLIYKYPQLGIPTAAMIMNSEDKLTQLSINLGYKLYGEK